MQVKINGEIKTFENDLNIADILKILDIQREGVAVACNDTIIPKTQLDEYTLSDGDTLEIIRAVGGGVAYNS